MKLDLTQMDDSNEPILTTEQQAEAAISAMIALPGMDRAVRSDDNSSKPVLNDLLKALKIPARIEKRLAQLSNGFGIWFARMDGHAVIVSYYPGFKMFIQSAKELAATAPENAEILHSHEF